MVIPMGEEKKIGFIEGFFAKISVALIKLEEGLSVGDTLRFKGHTTDFTQKVDSMQINHENVEKAAAGESVGLKVADRVRPHDEVFKVEE